MVRKVVIIDDEPWTRGVVMKLAQWNRLGLEVVGEAADGETGLELIRKVLPDIVITDDTVSEQLSMPICITIDARLLRKCIKTPVHILPVTVTA